MIDLVATPVSPPAPGDDDLIPFSEYFEDVFVPENKLRLPIKKAHRDICDNLEAAYLCLLPPEIQFVCVTMPPRIGKTKINEGLATWGEGYFPDSQIIMTSYADELVKLSLGYVRRTMKEPWYIELFGDLLHGATDDHLSTTAGGNVYAEGVYGGMLGKGAGLKEPGGGYISLDDPSKAEQALSKNVAKKLEVQFETTIINRRNSDRCCPIIIIAQRLGLTDLVEYLKRVYKKETLVLKYPCFVNRKSQFPETYSDDRLEVLERTRIGRFALASQLQQEPIALGGNMIPVDKFKRYAPADRLLPWEDKVMICDTALKKGEGNDWWVIQTWGRIGRRVYLLYSVRVQVNSAEFMHIAADEYRNRMADQPNHPVSRFIIEDSAAGPGIIAGLNEGGIPATPIVPIKDKAQRMNDVLPYIETGCAYLPTDDDKDSAEWLPILLTELSAFSQDLTHEHDDQADCVAYALSEMLGSGLSIFDVLGQPFAS
jgi:predicted phage terminase large subunit-like protein